MQNTLYVRVFSVTLVLSAFLLFSVQPMLGKMLLPLLGGGASVWNTAMVFFQATLLAGYAYAHLTTKLLSVRKQAILHSVLFALFILLLPLSLPSDSLPPTGAHPELWQLMTMAIVAGGPFFMLAGTTPMLMRWFSIAPVGDAENPYFLYAASNVGSITALLSYPLLIEPAAGLISQTYYWSGGYALVLIFILICLSLVWQDAAQQQGAGNDKNPKAGDPVKLSWRQRSLWVLLAFIPSSLMLGVTSFITMDLASAPLFWIFPLALYVGSFVVAFARKEWLSYRMAVWLQTLFFAAVIFWSFQAQTATTALVFFHLGLFTLTALACHIDLARLRPDPSKLTEFFLLISVGGVLGGIFNALIAPQILVFPIEYPLVLALAAFIRFTARPEYTFKNSVKKLEQQIAQKKRGDLALLALAAGFALLGFFSLVAVSRFDVSLMIPAGFFALTILLIYDKRWSFAVAVTLAIVGTSLTGWGLNKDLLHVDRNYYGTVRIKNNAADNMRLMINGTTIHGSQALSEEYKLEPLSYYSRYGALGDVYNVLAHNVPNAQRIGVIGLGVGAVACLGSPERHYDFYEINPVVIDLAKDEQYFTYLSDCGASVSTIIGDGRMQMHKAEDRFYDMVIVDAFSSDNVPVHLLTMEAARLYAQKVREGGMVVFHISNRYLDLQPVLSANAEKLGMQALFKSSASGKIPDTDLRYARALYGVLTRNPDTLQKLLEDEWRPYLLSEEGFRPWTDDYANILGVYRAPAF